MSDEDIARKMKFFLLPNASPLKKMTILLLASSLCFMEKLTIHVIFHYIENNPVANS